jgi:DNA-binding GntR family transcriptional regulator
MQITAISVADAVAAELRTRLLSGQYQGGQALRDTELAEEFGVARPTLRSAIQMLVADGLLERGRGRSAEVRGFTAEDAVDLYRVRRPIELVAVELIIEQKRPLDSIERQIREYTALPETVSWDVVADHDVAFHRAVFEAAGSPRLMRAFASVSTELRLLVAQLRPSYNSVADLAHEHELLLIALRGGDTKRAVKAWADHFDESENFFINLIKERTQ